MARPRRPSRTSRRAAELEPESRPALGRAARLDDAYRAQLAYLFERSPFYREKLARRARRRRGRRPGRRSRRCRSPTKQELRATVTPEQPVRRPPVRDADEIVRIYSTSGTTGTPSYIPLTAQRPRQLDHRLGAQLRRVGRPRRPADRLAPTTPARSSRARRSPSFDRIGLCHIPVGTGNTERLITAIELLRPEAAVLTPSYAAYLVEWAAERGFDLAGSSVERVLVAGEPGGGEPAFRAHARARLGRARDRGDGDRRHRRLAVGRVRAAGRDAPRRARLRARRADRPGHRASRRDRRRRHRRARPHAPAPPRRAAAALPHARPRAGHDEPVPVRPRQPAHPLHRPHRRHADRARRQRLPVGDPRGRGGFRAATSGHILVRPAAPGPKQEPPLPVDVESDAPADPSSARRSRRGCAPCSWSRRGSRSSPRAACNAASTSPDSSPSTEEEPWRNSSSTSCARA